MADYIKREDAKDTVINIVGREKIAKYVDEMSKHPSTKDIDYYDALMDAEDAIDDLPSADVAPVRHGHWIYDCCDIVCSECGTAFSDEVCYMMRNDTSYHEPKHCLWCGAEMSEENQL